MSGPKCDEYVLNEQRRQEELRRIEEQLKLEREQKSAEFNARMDEDLEAFKERLYKRRERKIIAEAMDEAMKELGYDLIATLEPKKEVEVPVHAQVYSFSEGVGIQVIENGERISMEVVGLGTNTRKPTEGESDYLEERMTEFCDSFGRLEKVLQEKGIVKSAVIHHLPPNKKYARILNLDNFFRVEEVETLQTKMEKERRRNEIGEENLLKQAQRDEKRRYYTNE